MSEYVDFHYMPLEGKITGEQVLKQTEDAINDLGNKVYSLDIDQSEIDEAIEKSNEAINTANSALAAVTTGRSVWFNNVAEMIASDIEAGVTAETKGYYVANDGGNALYLIRQEKSGDVVDGGSLIALDNGNMAELVTDGTVNVKQFGAIGNGTDDDTTVFQNTSSYAQAKGFVPFVGVATYKITGSVTGTFNSFGEVTITGGGTVDIINLQEVVSDVSDIRDEVVDETASAKAYSESAATSATNAFNSESSAQATATALTDIYNEAISSGQIVAPAVDPTLTISGAAADAKVVGEYIDDVIEPYINLVNNDEYFLSKTNWVYNSTLGYYGKATNIVSSVPIPAHAPFKQNVVYTIMCTGYTEGNENATDTVGIRFRVMYTDATYQDLAFRNNLADWTKLRILTDPTKTISSILCQNVVSPQNIWHFKELVVAEGAVTEYTDFKYTAIDKYERKKSEETVSLYHNLFDSTNLLFANGWASLDGVDFYGSGRNLANYSNDNNGITKMLLAPIKANTQYTVSLEAYTLGDVLSTATNGLRVRITYQDDTFTQINWLNNVSSWQKQCITSEQNKTVKYITFSVVNILDNTWHIRNLQVEEGTVAHEYAVPQFTAVDKIYRENKDMYIVNNAIVPSYYFTGNYLPNKIADIKENIMKGTNTLTFCFVTDMHVRNNAKQSIKLVKYIGDNVNNVPFLLSGGDICISAGTSLDDVMAQADEWLQMLSVYGAEKTMQIMGNHDFNGYSGGTYELSKAQTMYYALNSNVRVVRPANELYYYIDFPNENIRIIVIDDYDLYSDLPRGGHYGISQGQYDWILNTALNCSNKYILFAMHQTCDPTLTNYEAIYEPLQLLLKAFKNKTTVTVNQTATGVAFTHDFTNDTNNLVCVLSGHCHKDEYHVDDGVLAIVTNCDALYSNVSGYTRSVGTVTEQSFDVVTIDTTNSKIYMTRIGAGTDREYSY